MALRANSPIGFGGRGTSLRSGPDENQDGMSTDYAAELGLDYMNADEDTFDLHPSDDSRLSSPCWRRSN